MLKPGKKKTAAKPKQAAPARKTHRVKAKAKAKKPAAKASVAKKATPAKGAARPPKPPSFKGLTAAESLHTLAQAYSTARAALAPDANDRERAVYLVTLAPPARDADLAAAERASGIAFPADYKALLASLDGARFAADLAVLGTVDWITSTELIRKGREFVRESISYGADALQGCVPIANLGQPNDWLLYDPARQKYQYCLNADFLLLDDLAAALTRKARISAEVLANG